MKKVVFFLVCSFLVSCGSLKSTNPNTDRWIERTILPSQVTTNGIFFKEDIRTDVYNTSFESYSVGGYIDEDGTYYYNLLWDSFGWDRISGEQFEERTPNRKRPKKGSLYVNMKKGVAVYLYPDKGFNAFRVTLNPKSND